MGNEAEPAITAALARNETALANTVFVIIKMAFDLKAGLCQYTGDHFIDVYIAVIADRRHGVLIIVFFWWSTQRGLSETQTEPEPTMTSAPDVTPTAVPLPSLTPTAIERADVNSTGQVIASEQQPSTAVTQVEVLPTVTPTPEVRTVTSRTVAIDGDVTLRVTLAGTDFESDGAPLDFPIEAQTYLLTSDQTGIIEQQCLQLGLVHVLFDWNLEFVPTNNDILARADIHLYDDYCTAPGELRDTVPIEVRVPADASGELTLDLQGQRDLLNVPDLLDTSTSVFLVLRIANRPPQER